MHRSAHYTSYNAQGHEWAPSDPGSGGPWEWRPQTQQILVVAFESTCTARSFAIGFLSGPLGQNGWTALFNCFINLGRLNDRLPILD